MRIFFRGLGVILKILPQQSHYFSGSSQNYMRDKYMFGEYFEFSDTLKLNSNGRMKLELSSSTPGIFL